MHYPSPNYWPGRPYGAPIAFVVHTEAGNETSTQNWFDNNSSQVSAHYGASLHGTSLDQFVDAGNRAWANGIIESGTTWPKLAALARVEPYLSPNHLTISCETEDLANAATPVSDEQYAKVLYAAMISRARYPNSLRFVTTHSVISPQSRAHCAGERWVTSGRLAQLAADAGLELFLA